MRWIHATTPAELAHKAKLIEKIDAWWRAFTDHADQIDAMYEHGSAFDEVGFMRTHLEAQLPVKAWEYGPAHNKAGHRLCITPAGRHELRPFFHELIERAPKLERWEFYPSLLQEEPEQALRNVKSRCKIDASEWQVEIARLGVKLDLTWYGPESVEQAGEDVRAATLIATEALLGEERLDRWVGPIDFKQGTPVVTIGKDEPSFVVPFAHLPSQAAELLDETRSHLPEQPWHIHLPEDGPGDVVTFKLQEEYDAEFMGDLLVGRCAIPGLLVECWRGHFSPLAFSKCEETFACIQITREEAWLDDLIVETRAALEDDLDAALRESSSGCVVGGGTGKRFLYTIVALSNLDAALEVLREWALCVSLPRATWLRFCDTYLQGEWIGLLDETLPPPDFREEV